MIALKMLGCRQCLMVRSRVRICELGFDSRGVVYDFTFRLVILASFLSICQVLTDSRLQSCSLILAPSARGSAPAACAARGVFPRRPRARARARRRAVSVGGPTMVSLWSLGFSIWVLAVCGLRRSSARAPLLHPPAGWMAWESFRTGVNEEL